MIVFDYKTGSTKSVRELPDDPVVRGTKLQLLLYALAVAPPGSAPRVSAHYWFLTSPKADPLVGYDVDAPRLDRFRSVLGSIVDGVEAGMFLANPGRFDQFFGTNQNCAYCDFDRICPRSRAEQWTAKTMAPTDHAVASYVSLVGGGA